MQRGILIVLGILLLPILLLSCKEKIDYRSEYEKVLSENSSLIVERDNLKEEIVDLQSEIMDLRSEIGDFEDSYRRLRSEMPDCSIHERQIEFLKQTVEIHKLNYESYRYGEGICITRNGVRICGAEKVIDYLNDHYCP